MDKKMFNLQNDFLLHFNIVGVLLDSFLFDLSLPRFQHTLQRIKMCSANCKAENCLQTL